MPIKTTGTISLLSDIVAEFGGTAPHNISEYMGEIPKTTNVAWSDFYGLSSLFTLVINANVQNADIHAMATTAGWNGVGSLEVIVNPDVWLWSDTTATAGAVISGAFPGGLVLNNNGVIMGKGGQGGSNASQVDNADGTNTGDGEDGGPALSIASTGVIVNNLNGAYIAGGGGGGGAGIRVNHYWGGVRSDKHGGGGGGAGGGDGGGDGPGLGGAINQRGTDADIARDIELNGLTIRQFGGNNGGAGGGGGYALKGPAGGGGGGRILTTDADTTAAYSNWGLYPDLPKYSTATGNSNAGGAGGYEDLPGLPAGQWNDFNGGMFSVGSGGGGGGFGAAGGYGGNSEHDVDSQIGDKAGNGGAGGAAISATVAYVLNDAGTVWGAV